MWILGIKVGGVIKDGEIKNPLDEVGDKLIILTYHIPILINHFVVFF